MEMDMRVIDSRLTILFSRITEVFNLFQLFAHERPVDGGNAGRDIAHVLTARDHLTIDGRQILVGDILNFRDEIAAHRAAADRLLASTVGNIVRKPGLRGKYMIFITFLLILINIMKNIILQKIPLS